MTSDEHSTGDFRDAPEGPAFAWDEESHPLEASWGYQREFVAPMFGPSAEVVLAQEPPPAGGRVLDAGCGTGALALLAAERVGADGTVAAIDLNPAQLAVAHTLDRAARVEWRQGDVAELPYEDDSFDVVYCQHVLQFVPDRVGTLRELGRVARSGERVVVVVWGPLERNPLFATLADSLDALGDTETAAIVRSPRVFAEPEPLLVLAEEAGLSARLASFDVPVRFPSARRPLEELPPPLPPDADAAESERREAALAAASAALEPLEGPDGFAFADRIHVLVGMAP